MSEDNGDEASGRLRRATGRTEARPSHQSAPRPSAVLLDFHNTLAVVRSVDEWIDEASDLVAGGPAPGAIPRERIRNVWVEARRLFPDLDWDLDATSHRHAFVSTLSHDDAIPIDLAAALYTVMPNQWVLNAGASDFIARASAAGTLLGIVSNIALDIRPALERWGIATAFDAVILSYEVGYVKPDPRIFRLAADALGVDPTDCLMIGDSANDDVGGVAVGMPCLIVPPDGTWRAFALASR